MCACFLYSSNIWRTRVERGRSALIFLLFKAISPSLVFPLLLCLFQGIRVITNFLMLRERSQLAHGLHSLLMRSRTVWLYLVSFIWTGFHCVLKKNPFAKVWSPSMPSNETIVITYSCGKEDVWTSYMQIKEFFCSFILSSMLIWCTFTLQSDWLILCRRVKILSLDSC